MSGSTESLSRKISGAQDLQGVVRSMKALAAASIGQYEKAVASLDDYYRTVELALVACLHQAGPNALVANQRAARNGNIGAVVFGSDQGLVGRFNEVLLEFALRTLKTLSRETTKIWAVGDRIHELMADIGPMQTELLSVPTSITAITPLVGQILLDIEAAGEQGDIGEIHVFYNHPKSGASYEPISKRLLPLDQLWQSTLIASPWPTTNLPQVIDGVARALPAFIREYLFVLLFQACAESLASENASRLAAMQRAEKNIDDILDELQRTFHRNRQASIDEELFDVIAGYEALLGKSATIR
jgi:F-type H+-transporting ATPase subunit gamma